MKKTTTVIERFDKDGNLYERETITVEETKDEVKNPYYPYVQPTPPYSPTIWTTLGTNSVNEQVERVVKLFNSHNDRGNK